jgi:hypothetical protein
MFYRETRIYDEDPKPPRLYAQNGTHVWRERPAKGLSLHHSPPPVRKLLK